MKMVPDKTESSKMKKVFVSGIMMKAMKGIHSGYPKETKEEIENFYRQFLPLAEWTWTLIPKTLSLTSLAAVTFKAALAYDKQKAEDFCLAVTKGVFNGTDDPAFLLWKALSATKNKGKENTQDNYRRCVSAARAFCEGRKLKDLEKAKKDIFEWKPGLKIPDKFSENAIKVLEEIRMATATN